jgi:hypothetical protein
MGLSHLESVVGSTNAIHMSGGKSTTLFCIFAEIVGQFASAWPAAGFSAGSVRAPRSAALRRPAGRTKV